MTPTPNPFIEKVLKEFENEFKYLYGEKFAYIGSYPEVIDFLRTTLAAAQEEGYRRAVEEIDKKIPFLRQWLNEKPIEMLVTDKAIKRFLIPEALQPKE